MEEEDGVAEAEGVDVVEAAEVAEEEEEVLETGIVGALGTGIGVGGGTVTTTGVRIVIEGRGASKQRGGQEADPRTISTGDERSPGGIAGTQGITGLIETLWTTLTQGDQRNPEREGHPLQ